METRKSSVALTVSSGKPVLGLAIGLLAGEDFVPGDLALAAVRLFDGGVEDADGGGPDVAAGAVAFNEGDDGAVGDGVFAVGVLDGLAFGGDGDAVVAGLHDCDDLKKSLG